MWSPPQVCKEPGCGATSDQGECYCKKHLTDNSEIARSRERKKAPHHRFYGLAAWRNKSYGLQIQIIRRDPLCKDPFKIGCHNPSAVADHIKDHKGDYALFFDPLNLQGLCKPCHDKKTGRNTPHF